MKDNELTQEEIKEVIERAQLDRKCPAIKIKEHLDKLLEAKREGRCSR